MTKRLLIFFTSFILLLSCATERDYIKHNELKTLPGKKEGSKFLSINEIPKFNKRKFLIAPGHLLSISHPSDNKLKGKFRVNFDGLLRLPYNVRIKTEGLTLTDLRKKVRLSYTKFFQAGVNKVALRLITRQYYVEVRGFVKKPGRYLVTRNQSIDRVIDRAGGLKGDLKKDFLTAVMNQRGKAFTISLNKFYEDITFNNAFTWTGGDSIFINLMNDDSYDTSVPMISVLGGVLTPGKVLFKQHKDIFYYLGKSGGVQSTISLDQAYIIRTTSSGLKKIKFDVTDMVNLPAIQENDVIMISSKQDTTWDKFLQKTAQVTGILASIALLILAL